MPLVPATHHAQHHPAKLARLSSNTLASTIKPKRSLNAKFDRLLGREDSGFGGRYHASLMSHLDHQGTQANLEGDSGGSGRIAGFRTLSSRKRKMMEDEDRGIAVPSATVRRLQQS
jgi:hypothetical protein